jgi:hypothetical protein
LRPGALELLQGGDGARGEKSQAHRIGTQKKQREMGKSSNAPYKEESIGGRHRDLDSGERRKWTSIAINGTATLTSATTIIRMITSNTSGGQTGEASKVNVLETSVNTYLN